MTNKKELIDLFSRREKFAISFIISAIAWYFIQNCIFGWNMRAQSPAEGAADFMVLALLILGIVWKPSNATIRIDNSTVNWNVDTSNDKK